MRRIYKYKLGFEGEIVNITARIEKILDIQSRGSDVVLWALINDDFPEKELDIIAIGTGWDLPSGADEYLGTAQDEFGLVWHYFTTNSLKLEKLSEIDWGAVAQAIGSIGVKAEEVQNSFSRAANIWRDVL